MQIKFADCSTTVSVENRQDPVLDVLRLITSGWELKPLADASDSRIVLRRRGRDVLIEVRGRKENMCEPGAVSAACTLVLTIVQEAVADRPDLLCLHAGAARIGEALVVFPSGRRAGKSTLLAYLASRGEEIFADDVLPVELGTLTAVAPGVSCRLRLPLPADCPASLTSFYADRAGPRDAWYGYVDHPDGTLAEAGRRAVISAVVLLERVAHGAEGLHRIPAPTALEALLLQNFGVAAPATHILAAFEALATSRPAYVLRYSSLDGAADCLAREFRTRAPVLENDPIPFAAARFVGSGSPTIRPFEPTGVRVRSDTARVHHVQGRAFVSDDATGAIVSLDGIGPIVWEILEEPYAVEEVEEVLGYLYPEIPAAQISRDTRSFLSILDDHGLLKRP